MPVSKISDAPANIRKLNGAKLTLSQVNWILRVYDGLKGKQDIESPMAVAITQFKRAHNKKGKSWVKKQAKEVLNFEAAIAPRVTEGDQPFTGREWEVTIIGPATPADLLTISQKKYVRSKNGRLYLARALEKSVPIWEGVKVYDNHLTDAEFEQRQGMRSPKTEWLGIITQPWWNADAHALCGVYKVSDKDFAEKLKFAYDNGTLNHIGLSIDTFTVGGVLTHEGQQLPVVEGFKIEHRPGQEIFTRPRDQRTEDYITGRFG